MGDRTCVTLRILTSQREKAEALDDFEEANYTNEEDDITSYQYDEVNYGTLDFLDSLQYAGIAFDSSWEQGSGFDGGTTSGRYTAKGEYIEKDIFDNAINPSQDELIKLIDHPEKLREYILIHQKKITVLPLETDQEANGKLYLTHKLIGSTPITKED